MEDDDAAREVLAAGLEARGWKVRSAATGRRALELLDFAEPDVVVLDLGLPDLDGVDVCRHIRRMRATVPIVVLTADGSEERMIAALDEGADDYVTKPYSMPQLLARLRVAVRHHDLLASVVADDALALGDVRVDLASHVVEIGGSGVPMPRREFLLLSALLRNAGKVLTYRTLSFLVWGPEHDVPVANLRNLVKLLRDRLGNGPVRPVIETESGVGYRLTLPQTVEPPMDTATGNPTETGTV